MFKNHYIWGPLFGSRKRVIYQYPFHWMAIRCINWCCRQPTGQYKVPVRQGCEKFHDAWGGQVACALGSSRRYPRHKLLEKMLKGSMTLSGFWSELSWKGPSHCLLTILAAWGWLLLDAPEVVRWVFRTCCGDWRFEVKLKGKDSRSSKSVGLQGEKM